MEERSDGGPRRKKRRSSNDSVSITALRGAVKWLTPKDLANCAQVCQSWNVELRLEDSNWKLPASNVANVATLQALEKALPSKERQKLNYQAIAKGWALHLRKHSAAPPPRVHRQVTIKAEDLFLSLSLKYNDKTVWAGCKNLKDTVEKYGQTTKRATVTFLDFLLDSPVEDIVLAVPPHGHHKRPYYKVLDAISADAVFWRCDTGQSFSLFSGLNLSEVKDTFKEDFIRLPTHGSFMSWEKIRPLAQSSAGHIARSVCAEDWLNFMCPELLVTVQPALPSPGSPNEPDWLKSLRSEGPSRQIPVREYGGGQYSRSFDEDDAEEEVERRLEESLTYQLAGIEVGFCCCFGEDTYDSFHTSGDFLIFLDGLEWV